MKKYIYILLIFLPNLCFAKCGIEKYTLTGAISDPNGTPIENVRVEIEWLDFNGRHMVSGLSNKKGVYVVNLMLGQLL